MAYPADCNYETVFGTDTLTNGLLSVLLLGNCIIIGLLVHMIRKGASARLKNS